MAYTYWLPDESGNKVDYTTESNSVIIVGANGAGKSKLGAWIEQRDFAKVHRIAAQRGISFNKNIPLKNYTEAENLVLFGESDAKNPNVYKKGNRWGWNEHAEYTTRMIIDFEYVLAALLAMNANEEHDYVVAVKEAKVNRETYPNPPTTVIEKLFHIWDEVLPQRKLSLEDSKFYSSFTKDGDEVKYSATEMSDGERSVLYLAAQVLCVPENKILIMDEPELHLHPSIMNRLWKALEQYRPDCLFIYITHDLQFASMHSHAEKIWIKEYDGHNWKLQIIEGIDLPEELLLEIMGSRKNVIFVEGERNSYDTQLYSELYPDYHIVPCGSCTQVIARTKAFRNNSDLHECQVYGIIDRDYRSDYEIEKYKEQGIYTIGVAEVENLFLVEELIRLMAKQFGEDVDVAWHNVKQYVVEVRFNNQINGQICESVVSEIKYRLSSAEISKVDENKAKESLETVLSSIDYDQIKTTQETKFQQVLDEGDYTNVLRVFNQKSLSKSIGHFLGVDNRQYCEKVINLLQGIKHDEIVSALSPYLPTEIPR
ncbi:DUF4435 domain-containing protein [Ruminococcus difficilis]|uniref:AAA family ATPase n=1 Tax=Ruminococcus difficilis TaxID=2763069 RepID=A0A934WQB8_9FIRM|nr:DUF4435 domain-containing protein [Ruminococcus difficilis]MBK6087413.1 AAA family ATPase [Ruminococcus difficilis]